MKTQIWFLVGLFVGLVLGLRITSVDFLKSKEGKYNLTDINSGPNFNTIENGSQILGDFLLNEAKK